MPFLLQMGPSLWDERDWKAKNFIGNKQFPETLDLRPKLTKIRNQGEQGSCLAQTVACMKEFQELMDNNIKEHFSPQFVYDNRFNQNSEGMTCRDVMKILQKKGCPLEKSYPYNYISKPENIPNHVYEEAKNFIIKSYALIDELDDLKKALAHNGPCLIAFPVYNYGEEMWIPNKPRQAMRGGHAMTVVGYNKDSFIIRNSWGEEWGDKGYCYYKFTDWGSHFDCWTTVDEKLKINNDDDLPDDNDDDLPDDDDDLPNNDDDDLPNNDDDDLPDDNDDLPDDNDDLPDDNDDLPDDNDDLPDNDERC